MGLRPLPGRINSWSRIVRNLVFGLWVVACCGVAGPASAESVDRPNVVLILVDDLGVSDVGCQGNTFIETPHIDKLAKDGTRFTNSYSACTVCSPTRASLLTGQYPARLHITDWIAGHVDPKAKLKVPDWTMHLSTKLFNIAKGFKSAGYATASIGKWHLGGPEYYPEEQGFDVNIGGNDRGQPGRYFPPYKVEGLPDGPPDEFLTDRLTAEANRWIEANKDRPFFLYLPHYAVHTPLAGKSEVIDKYKRKVARMGIQANATYAALVESVDDSVGAIRAKLDELGLSDRTILIFTSDNGGLIGRPNNPITTNPPYRAGKGSAYEGGVRVPLIVLWPGETKPGSTTDAQTITPDFLPTLAEACGFQIPQDHPIDGVSLVPALKRSGNLKPRPLYWHYPHYHPGGATPYSAVRDGDWRLVEFFEDGRVELFNLAEDVGETKNVAAAHPDITNRLLKQLAAWRKEVGAQLPSPNPDAE